MRSYEINVAVHSPLTLRRADGPDDREAMFRYLNDLLGEVSIDVGAFARARLEQLRQDAAGAGYVLDIPALAEPMGLAVRDGKIYVGTKQALYRLTDTDGNGEADLFECLNQSWGYTGSYNAFVYGPVFDKAGNFILANAGHSGRWDAAYMGWALRLSPDGKKLGAICSGLREPNGIGTLASAGRDPASR